MSLRLIGAQTSPYVRKVRVVMAEKKIEAKCEWNDVWSAHTTISESNPLGKVPCLILEDGSAVYDSRVIVEYLDTLTPVGKLIPAAGKERLEVRTWEALADGLCDAAILARLEQTWPGRTEAQRSQAWIERQMQKVQGGLTAMSKALADKPWCFGNNFTLADISVCVALAYLDLRFPAISWRAQHENLAKLFEKIALRQSFIDSAPPAA